MARPKKNQMTEQEVANTTPEVVGITNDESIAAEPVAVLEPVQEILETPTAPIPEAIFPEADRYEMDRYFCVINNSTQASRIMQDISHQRELFMWGVHQYDNSPSRNSYARSFYFKNRDNAVKVLEYTNKLLG
jgi:hypothetical protein